MSKTQLPAEAPARRQIQLKISAGPVRDPGAIQSAADKGLAGPAAQLPHFDRIQSSFGRHAVGGIEAHVGGEAAASAADRMGALAYATGNSVAFRSTPDLHTAAHEAAHVIQQRAGVHLKSGVGEAGDEHERHADAVADCVVRGESAEPLLDKYAASGAPSRGVQHVIRYGKGEDDVLGTWASVKSEKASIRKLAEDAFDEAKTQLEKDPAFEVKRLQKAWNNLSKAKKEVDANDSKALSEALVTSYESSVASSKHRKARQGDGTVIADALIAAGATRDEHFEASGKGRSMMMTKPDKDMARFTCNGSSSDAKSDAGKDRAQTQLATAIKAQIDTKPQEIQVALATSKDKVMVSGNENADNKAIGELCSDRESFEVATAKMLAGKLGGMSKQEVMDDRVLRHSMKIFDRLRGFLADGGMLVTPENVKTVFKGRHAEIRIYQHEDQAEYRTPTGTRYPCFACKLFFAENGVDTGKELGELWLTGAGISSHIEKELLAGRKVGNLEDAMAVAKEMAATYLALDAGIEMGLGVTKHGDVTHDHNADSDSELDDDDYARVTGDIAATAKSGTATHTDRALVAKPGKKKRKPDHDGPAESKKVQKPEGPKKAADPV